MWRQRRNYEWYCFYFMYTPVCVHLLCWYLHVHIYNYTDKDRCQTCNGNKVARDRKILEVHIDKGMKDGQKITFRGESNQVGKFLLGSYLWCIILISTGAWSWNRWHHYCAGWNGAQDLQKERHRSPHQYGLLLCCLIYWWFFFVIKSSKNLNDLYKPTRLNVTFLCREIYIWQYVQVIVNVLTVV